MKITVGIIIALSLGGMFWVLRPKQSVLPSPPAAAASSASKPSPVDAGWAVDPSLFPTTDTLVLDPAIGPSLADPLPPADLVIIGGPSVLPAAKPAQTQLEEFADPVKFVEDRTKGGIGVLLFDIGGKAKVGGIAVGSSAETSGIQVGDIILSVEGHPVSGLSIKDISARVRGLVGTKVTLEVEKSDKSVVSYTLARIARRDLQAAPTKVR
ncbi:PDZ domain-containing protein [Roseimicrobium sp. ORNL1]|uniref:S41 family peptidase n=1 Tax=Roseimicrobium sp. ORNL1 TaxID=2711231 RepID=UPI0013E158E9|nr:PDZ domain-containing protein [Roseimicrobium sp. ORNL1]QIF00561.1 hypothetical protein G5S37_03170 [Roseimicrobium sp. ORNL1]